MFVVYGILGYYRASILEIAMILFRRTTCIFIEFHVIVCINKVRKVQKRELIAKKDWKWSA